MIVFDIVASNMVAYDCHFGHNTASYSTASDNAASDTVCAWLSIMPPMAGDNHAKTYSTTLRTFLQNPDIIQCLEDPNIITDVIFMNTKGVRITEEDAIHLNDQFDINCEQEVVDTPRKRVFTLPTTPKTLETQEEQGRTNVAGESSNTSQVKQSVTHHFLR